ncbi:sensor histidine kinase [Radicibacter daui]|uniref:sensor histidine kinase n=1 Tax=Radicibacter daui TaxID=3064829 RepID=UPI004046ED58
MPQETPSSTSLPVVTPGRERQRREALLAVMPVCAIVLLVVLIGLLLWILRRDERDVAHTTLISDALWVEQTLRFQLGMDEDTLARLALDAGRPDPEVGVFLDRVRVMLGNNPELIAIAWLKADGHPVAAVPPLADTAVPPEIMRAKHMAQFSARPVYGDLRRMPDGALVVDVAVPVPGEEAQAGAVVATVSLTTLVARQIPWWIAEKYAVRLENSAGEVLAEKNRVEPLDPSLVHRIAFDPPIPGTFLSIAPYRLPATGRPRLLVAAIIGLALLALVSLAALQRDVLRRRRVEERLRTETVFRRAMENSLTIGMRARDLDGGIIYVNSAFCRMVGFQAGELVGKKPPMPYWLPDQIEETRARHDAQIKGELKPKSWETRFRRRDGSVFDALLYEAPLVDADGVAHGWMGSIIDITDRKMAAELARRQAETLQRTGRLVTLGEMASTLAHELNQPLAAIASYAAGSLNMMQGGAFETAEVVGALEKLARQAERAGRIISGVQDIVRKREPTFGPVAVASVVEQAVAFADPEARNAGIRVETMIAPDLPGVTADRVLLEQVLLNLVRNGLEAMVAAPRALSQRERVLVVSAEREGGEIRLNVADRGGGIDASVDGRLFDAFVSTKAEGMGIGLNICRSIVELHHGRLTHAPRPGGGTIFTVTLPVETGVEAA